MNPINSAFRLIK